MSYSRSAIVSQAQAWIGCKESDGSHKQIIDVYNAHTPLARGYKMQYTDSWCAAFCSAVSIKYGYTAIIPTECSCIQMITLLKNLGSGSRMMPIPSPGDLILYDWQDTTGSTSDNTGTPDHIGIVENVENDKITVIEGNMSNAVGRRTLSVNGKYKRFRIRINRLTSDNPINAKNPLQLPFPSLGIGSCRGFVFFAVSVLVFSYVA